MKRILQNKADIAVLSIALVASATAQDTTTIPVANSFTDQEPTLTLPTNSLPTSLSSSAMSSSMTSSMTTSMTGSMSSTIPSTGTGPITALTGTELAIFTAAGAVYTATAISSMVQIAGYELGNGGSALVGGQEVQVSDANLLVGGTTFPFAAVSASSTEEIVQTSTSDGQTTLVYTTSTAPVAGATTESMSASAASSSASAASESSSAGAMPVATAKPKSAVAALGGIAGLLWLLG